MKNATLAGGVSICALEGSLTAKSLTASATLRTGATRDGIILPRKVLTLSLKSSYAGTQANGGKRGARSRTGPVKARVKS
jgi:hypothetical protein